jgi:hypothetical protein
MTTRRQPHDGPNLTHSLLQYIPLPDTPGQYLFTPVSPTLSSIYKQPSVTPTPSNLVTPSGPLRAHGPQALSSWIHPLEPQRHDTSVNNKAVPECPEGQHIECGNAPYTPTLASTLASPPTAYHTQPLYYPTPQHPPYLQTHNTYAITSTQRTTPIQPHHLRTHSPNTQTPRSRGMIIKILCNQTQTEYHIPPTRNARANIRIHTLTNSNGQPYLKFKFDDTAPAKNTPVPIKYTAISTDIPKNPKENNTPYPNDTSTPTNTRLMHHANGPDPTRTIYNQTLRRLPSQIASCHYFNQTRTRL